MKTAILALVLLSLNGFANSELQTVSFVDPIRYVGTWYQISRNPLPFEPRDCMCAQQTLTIESDGRIGVFNSCNEGSASGPLREIRGFATNDDPVSNARFTVDFGLPQTGQYWIIGLDGDYRWAVVSDPGRRSLYILSKTPLLADELYQLALIEAAKQVGTGKLLRTNHEGCSYP